MSPLSRITCSRSPSRSISSTSGLISYRTLPLFETFAISATRSSKLLSVFARTSRAASISAGLLHGCNAANAARAFSVEATSAPCLSPMRSASSFAFSKSLSGPWDEQLEERGALLALFLEQLDEVARLTSF